MYSADINSNLKLPWNTFDITSELLGATTFNEILFLVKNSSNSRISIINESNNLINEFDFDAHDFIDASIIDEHLVLVINNEIIIYSIEEDSVYLEVNSSLLETSTYTAFVSQEKNIIASIRNQGFKIGSIDILFDQHIISSMTPSFDAYNAIKLLESGDLVGVVVGKDEKERSYAGIFHRKGNDFTNYIPLNFSSSYYQQDPLHTVIIDYKSGEKSPVSIIELDNNNIMFSNSGLRDDGSENRGGVIQLDLELKELNNIYNSVNTNILGGQDGIFNADWNENYMVINQIEKYNNKIWVVNPYNELNGDVISSYNILSNHWTGVNVSNPDNIDDIYTLYMPQEISFDNSGQLWVAFENKLTLDQNGTYSNGGIRYVNSNNRFERIDNDEILIGGEDSDVWSIDVCSYNDTDVLWVLSSDGVQGYTIVNNQLSSILATDLFIDIPFDKGDHIRCDQYANVWITTMHSGLRVMLSEGSYTESWPSFSGLTSDNSGLLSDIVYDIDFDNETGEVYLATELGISILESPFGQVSYVDNDRYKIYFDKNPFLVPKDDKVIISNVPLGSTLKVMSLNGKVLRTLKEDSFTMYEWDGKDEFGSYVHSGIYIVGSFNSEEKTAVGKLAVIREK